MQSADRIPWNIVFRALLPFAIGYFISYLFRAVNQVIAPDLISELGLAPGELGRLTAAYLFAFMLFQLPLGVLLDRFGPRRVQAALLLVAAIGALLFSRAEDSWSLTFARAILGLGLSGGLMAAFKANALWLPMSRVALGNSTAMAFGALGLVAATRPADWLAQQIGWRPMFDLLAAVTVGVAALIFLLVPKDGHHGQGETLSAQLRVMPRVFTDRVFWRVAPMVAMLSGTFISVQTLWAGRWLVDVGGLDRSSAADVLMLMAIGFAIGSLTTGWIVDRAQRRGFAIETVVAGAFTIFATGQALVLLEAPVHPALPWILFGFAGQASNLGYATLAAHFGPGTAGRAQSAANLLLFATAWGLQWGIGEILDYFPGPIEGAIDPLGYRWAFGLALALQILALYGYLRADRRKTPAK
jgi:predicted MFS family arabinose efflux permease